MFDHFIDQLSSSSTPASRHAVILGLCALLIFAAAQPASAAGLDHSRWNRLLAEYVDDEGRVDYDGLENRERDQLDAYLASLAEANVEKMTETERLAFWINAYNAGIVDAILQGYSPESSLSRVKLFRWYSLRVAGKDRTPNEIEHEILRKRFREPRIHFALVCAATSCPKLRREAYRGEVLDQQLDDQARRFIHDPDRNRIDTTEIRLSSIFEWFEEDFSSEAGSVPAFVARYLDGELAAALQRKADHLEFLEYDWTLNAQREKRKTQNNSATENHGTPRTNVCDIDLYRARVRAGESGFCAG